ncbi:MAG: VWA domain-containing protein [Marinifilaceae bacterium]|nr:VWA domain-containing protein [Marinifilaceae bacterium]
MFRFAHTWVLYLLVLIPVLILFFTLMQREKRKAMERFGDMNLIAPLMPMRSSNREVFKFIVLLLVILFTIIGAAGPQFGSKLKQVQKEGIEIEILLDVSNSMLAEDITPNRLERSKMAISRMVDKLSNDKVGLIVFAGEAYVQLPITTDYSATKLFLSNIDTDIVPVQGTAIGKAIDLAVKSFSDNESSSKAIIVITDGENHQDDAVAAAKRARERGVNIFAIGMGQEQGVPIPDGKGGYRKDGNGQTVVSKLDEAMLKEIVAAGEGVYIRATNTDIGLDAILGKISQMEKGVLEERIYTDYDDKFPYFLWVALALAIFELMVLERKNRYLMKINLFKEKK